jgi:hypothetical protein
MAPVVGATAELADVVEAWLAGPHADYHSPSFSHWNKTGAVPEDCAACHSGPGFIDYLGADGSQASIIDRPAPINAPIGCASCHTAKARAVDSVRFPSRVTVDGAGASALCMACHQGRTTGDTVATAMENRAEDTVSGEITFIDVHRGVAAAVLQGAVVRGGFQYPGRSYAGRFAHVPAAGTCISCHDAHSTRVATQGCLSCHRGVADVRDIRTRHLDFDGDGESHGGIRGEILGLQERLHRAMQAYAADVSRRPMGYAPGQFPFFFNDTDGDGEISGDEKDASNRYANWTPRLLKAAYNYHFIAADPGAYAHNPGYALQLLYDSLDSLSARIAVEMADLHRP